jgi:hypothetical protein
MATSDLTLSVIIIFIFIILFVFNIIVIRMQHIKDNWNLYRCQPTVMPFASFFGHNTSENFAYCIQNIQNGFMGDLLKPINLNIGILGNITSGLTKNLNSARSFMSNFRFNLFDIFKNIFSVLFNIMVEIQRMMINIKDLFGKLSGLMVTLIYILDGAVMTMTSAWGGPPGQLVRALCFHPETQLDLKNGEKYPMKDIPLNSILLNGSRVCSVMQISNLDNNGNFIEKMYKVKRNIKKEKDIKNDSDDNNVNDDSILVSGSHLVYDTTIDQFIHVKDLLCAEISDINCPVLYCLITTDHTIQIGEWIFHDWEDSNGSLPKNIGN